MAKYQYLYDYISFSLFFCNQIIRKSLCNIETQLAIKIALVSFRNTNLRHSFTVNKYFSNLSFQFRGNLFLTWLLIYIICIIKTIRSLVVGSMNLKQVRIFIWPWNVTPTVFLFLQNVTVLLQQKFASADYSIAIKTVYVCP